MIRMEDIAAKCPFYERAYEKSITCEGVITGTLCTNRFDTPEIKKVYLSRYCASHDYKKCALARVLIAKYMDE